MESRKIHLLTGFSILLSGLFNYFFLFNRWGVSVLIFNVALWVIGYFAWRGYHSFNIKRYFVTGVLLVIISIPYLRFDFPLFSVINTFLLFGVYAMAVTPTWKMHCFKMFILIAAGLFAPLFKLHKIFTDNEWRNLGKRKSLLQALVGVFMAIIMLLIIVPLLGRSDPVFQQIIDRYSIGLDGDQWFEWFLRVIVFVFLSMYFYVQLILHEVSSLADGEWTLGISKMSLVSSNIFLVMLDVVYVTFSFIQIKYLFLGNALPEGISYATYAREGFFQLVGVTVLNVLLVVIFNYFKKNHTSVNVLLSLTIVCTYIMTIAAFYKMSLYESSYGYTRLRLLVYLFLIAEGLALVPIMVGIFKKKFPFLEWAVLTVFVFYLGVSFINVDSFVVERNLERALSDSQWQLDTEYLGTLSYDALKVIEENVDSFSGDRKAGLLGSIDTIKNRMLFTDYGNQWFEWNASRAYTKEFK